MILSGLKIADEVKAGRIFISDFDEKRLNPNSYNLRLADEMLAYNCEKLDMKKDNPYYTFTISQDGFLLLPGQIYLARTMERTRTDCYVPMLEGRSSVGRLGIFIHATAGFGDVGFDGYWTLELSCVQPVRIYPGVEICQIYYHTIYGDYVPYRSGKYQGNHDVQPSMLWKDFQEGKS
jgi:dCTP deaminase